MITLPKLLDGNGNEVARLRPLTLSITEQIVPLSTANMVLMPDQTIPDRSYVELFTVNGSAGVYRSRVPKTGYKQTNSYTLEHAICEVGDWLVRDEIEKTQKTLSEAITQIFAYYGGSRWQLGTISATGNVILSASNANVLQTINSLIAQVDGAVMRYDFTTDPWTVSVGTISSTVTAEGRVSRNVTGASIQKDDSNLCTRVWLAGLQNGYMDADTISEYGVIERKLTGSYTSAEAEIVASAYLAKYKRPTYTVTVDGVDFSALTGESLDRVEIGKLYRLVIPEDNVIIEQPIVTISWKDLVNSPEVVTVTLSKPVTTLIDFVKQSGFDADQARDYIHAEVLAANSEIYIYVENTESDLRERIKFAAEGIRAEVSAANSIIYTYIEQTASTINLSVENVASGLRASISMTAEEIRSDVSAGNSTVYSYIEQTASSITMVVENTASGLRASIQETAEGIRTDVSAANSAVYSYIEQTASSITMTVENTISDVRASIRETAEGIRTDVSAASSSIYSYIDQTASSIKIAVEDTVSGLQASILETASGIRTDVSAANSAIYSYIDQTASSIRIAVEDSASGLRAEIGVQADRIGLVVEGTGENASIKAAQIVAAVNDGASSVVISADHINLDGYLKATDITANFLDAKIAEIPVLHGTSASFSGSVRVASGLYLGSDPTDVSTNLIKAVIGVSVDDTTNTLTLTQANGTVTNFRKAASATIAGSWSGGSFTVTGADNALSTHLTNTGHWGNAANGEDPLKYYYKTYATINSGAATYDTGNATEINASSIHTAGYDSAKLVGTWDGRTLTVAKSTTGNASLTYSVTAGHSITYNSTSHKYVGTCNANVNATTRNTLNFDSGDQAYQDGVTNGSSGVKLVGAWNGRTLTVSKSTTGDTSLTYSVTAGHSITYNSTSHKYTGTCNANVNATTRNTLNFDSGDQAYQDGNTAGYTTGWNAVTVSSIAVYGSPAASASAITVRATAANGKTKDESINITTQRNNAYASGWAGCYGGVRLDSTTETTLGYGGSVTVYAQAFSTSGATSRTNVQSRKIKAPADRTVTAGISYNSTSHVYTATAYKDSSSASTKASGTEAYDAGYSSGYSTGYSSGNTAGGTAAGVRIYGTRIERVANASKKDYTISAGTPSYSYDDNHKGYLISSSAYADSTLMDSESTYTDDTAWQYGYADGYYTGMADYIGTAANWDSTVQYNSSNGYFIKIPNERNTGSQVFPVDASVPYAAGANSVYVTGVAITGHYTIGSTLYVQLIVSLSNGASHSGVYTG